MGWIQNIQQRYAVLRRADSRLPEHLQGREHLWSSRGASTTIDGELATFAGYATVYSQYVWVRKAISLIADAIAPLPLRVVDAQGEAQPDHPLSVLFATGNAKDDAATLWRIAVAHWLIAGEWCVQFVDDARGRPAEFWVRRPDWVGIVPTADPYYPAVLGYEYRPVGVGALAIPASELLHVRFHNPLSEWRGISPIHAVREGITLDLLAMGWTKGMLQRGGEPSFALSTKQALTPNEQRRLEAMLDAKRDGGRPLILSDDMTVLPYSFAPKDMEWLAQREMSRDEVGAIFNVPDEIMGFGQNTYENFEQAQRTFWTLGILPLIQRRDVALTTFWTRTRPLLRPGERLVTDTSSVGVLQEDDAPRIDKATKLFALGVPFNVLNEQLRLGVGAVPGGDVGYLPSSLLAATEIAAPLPAPAKAVIKAAGQRGAAGHIRTLQRIRREVARRATAEIDSYFTELADAVEQRARSQAKGWQAKALPDVASLVTAADAAGLLDVVGSFGVEVIELSWPTWSTLLGIEVEFGMDDPAVVDWLDQAAEQVAGIEETTRAAIVEVLQYGIDHGWTLDQLVRGDDEQPGLRSVVQELYRNRARTIGRTEIGNAQQRATVARYAAAGVSQVVVYDGGSAASCQACTDLNGETKTLDWATSHALEHPNCIRAFAPHFE